MRKTARSILLIALTLLSAVVLGVSAMITSAGFSLAATTALVMGGTGRPNPADFPGYMENVGTYYIAPNTGCQSFACLQPVTTPETAWPLYGGLDAPTWRDSILQGVEDLDAVVLPLLPALGPDNELVIFGYSQSGAIVAFEKIALAASPAPQEFIDFVIIGNVSRANGGLNGRFNGFSIPIVNFPFGPTVPTNTNMDTVDIAMKWDIIADAPLYLTNPIGLINALLGFEYVHGTYPDPTAASPDSTPGGYTQEQWQAIMDRPEEYAALNPDLINVQTYGDTKFITITPTVLPLVSPLHQIGLKPLADLIEPALRAFIEHTAYDRSIPYGQPTPFRFIPIFNPIALAGDLLLAIPQGFTQLANGLEGKPAYPLIDPPSGLTTAPSAASARFSASQTDAPLDGGTSQDATMVNESFSGSNELMSASVQETDGKDESGPSDKGNLTANEPEDGAKPHNFTALNGKPGALDNDAPGTGKPGALGNAAPGTGRPGTEHDKQDAPSSAGANGGKAGAEGGKAAA